MIARIKFKHYHALIRQARTASLTKGMVQHLKRPASDQAKRHRLRALALELQAQGLYAEGSAATTEVMLLKKLYRLYGQGMTWELWCNTLAGPSWLEGIKFKDL
jgi:hypothetical protein